MYGVKTLLQSNFEDLTKTNRAKLKDMYDIRPKEGIGCYLSVKVPSDYDEAGKGLHVNTRFQSKKTDYPVFPSEKYGNKLGRGKFASRTVNRNQYWRKNLMLEATTGMEICNVFYNSERQYSDEQKQRIYDLFTKDVDLRKDIIKEEDHCKALQKNKAKSDCFNKLDEMKQKLNQTDETVKELLSFVKPKK